MAHGTTHEAATNSREPVDRRPPQTVTEMVLNLADRHDRGPTFLDDKLTPRAWTFAQVIEQAKRHAAFLHAHQVQPGERMALIVIDSQDFMPAFFGIIFAGAVPVPMPVPVSTRALSSYVDNCRRIMTSAGCSAAFIPRMMSDIAGDAFTGLADLRCVLHVEDVPTQGPADFEPVQARPSDTCFLQFTSGSTSTPKGVVITHANLVANSHAIMHDWLNAGPDDIGASWLPLFHDMGLIGFVIAPLLTATPVVFIPTLSFVQRPSAWMNVVHTYRATISVSPNFGFALAVKRARDVEALDLSCLRVIGCGAEPINPETLQAFATCYARGGLGANVISPLYGLAEATLLASCRAAGEPLRVEEAVSPHKKVRPVPAPWRRKRRLRRAP
jgi:fatty-acyl-CoA synthase